MYPKFIEVHAAKDGIAVSINVENVIGFGGDGEGGGAFRMADNSMWQTKESYDELKALITDCGYLIRKADPRLDTENQLTEQMIMDEGMVGEPVWNTNKGRWYIIANWSNLKDDFLMELQGIYDILRYTAEDLKKFPLYRMKAYRMNERGSGD